MVYTKLERSFDAEELHKFLKGSLKTEEADEKDPNAVINKIERPPLPRGSTIFEMAKGEMEIERQTQYNGRDTLPLPGQRGTEDHSHHRRGPTPENVVMSHLLVPASSPVMGHRRSSRPSSRTSARSGSSSGSRSGSRARSKSFSKRPLAAAVPVKQATQSSGVNGGPHGIEKSRAKTSVAVAANSVRNIVNTSMSFRPPSLRSNQK